MYVVKAVSVNTRVITELVTVIVQCVRRGIDKSSVFPEQEYQTQPHLLYYFCSGIFQMHFEGGRSSMCVACMIG